MRKRRLLLTGDWRSLLISPLGVRWLSAKRPGDGAPRGLFIQLRLITRGRLHTTCEGNYDQMWLVHHGPILSLSASMCAAANNFLGLPPVSFWTSYLCCLIGMNIHRPEHGCPSEMLLDKQQETLTVKSLIYAGLSLWSLSFSLCGISPVSFGSSKIIWAESILSERVTMRQIINLQENLTQGYSCW